MTEIIIDDREKKDVQILASIIYDDMIVERLEIGDILARGIIFELKRPADFVSSIFNKHLFIQIANMTEKYKNAFLLVSGSFIETELLYHSRSKQPNFIGVVASCAARGCIPIFTDNLDNSLLLVDSLSKKMTDGKVRDRPVKRVNLRDRQIGIVCSLPGVSDTRAKALLTHFGSINGILTASEKELCGVPDIGPKTASKLIRILQKPYIG